MQRTNPISFGAAKLENMRVPEVIKSPLADHIKTNIINLIQAFFRCSEEEIRNHDNRWYNHYHHLNPALINRNGYTPESFVFKRNRIPEDLHVPNAGVTNIGIDVPISIDWNNNDKKKAMFIGRNPQRNAKNQNIGAGFKMLQIQFY